MQKHPPQHTYFLGPSRGTGLKSHRIITHVNPALCPCAPLHCPYRSLQKPGPWPPALEAQRQSRTWLEKGDLGPQAGKRRPPFPALVLSNKWNVSTYSQLLLPKKEKKRKNALGVSRKLTTTLENVRTRWMFCFSAHSAKARNLRLSHAFLGTPGSGPGQGTSFRPAILSPQAKLPP